MRLLIAEDELDLAEALGVFFEKNRFSVDVVNDGADAYCYASDGEYDAIILYVMMPKMNGIEVLKKLREDGNRTPIMMLTAKGEKDDRITGFNSGADDYLPKPFDPDELICRVRAMLRRGGEYRPTVLSFGGVSLNSDTGMLSSGELSVRLSGRKLQVMEMFISHPKIIFSADRIMERFAVSDAVRETGESFIDYAESAGHELTLSIEPDIIYCGDEYAVRRLVSVLLDNAVKYAEKDSQISFSLEKNKKGIVIRTSNKCEDLSTKDEEKLFDRFWRSDESRSSAGGFGIGLSIARSIAEGHKGTISAKVAEGMITFTAELKNQ